MAKKAKDLDSEVNLISFISLLSVLICSLLLAVVWIQIGSINVKQAVGGQSLEETDRKPALWVVYEDENKVSFQVHDGGRIPGKLQKVAAVLLDGKIDFNYLKQHIEMLKKSEPTLNTALIHPHGETSYEDIISLMDEFKKFGINELGVAPL